MRLVKGYRLLRFMNRHHGVVLRYLFGTAGWVGAFAATRSTVLANRLFAEFRADSFYIGLRKAARFARYAWRSLPIFNDPFFDFTSDATERELDALQKHLKHIRGKISLAEYLTDFLYIKAAKIHHFLINEKNPHVDIQCFYAVADQALALVELGDDKNIPSNKNVVMEDFNLDDARDALRDIATLLPNCHWPWYVISGTFLGLHREGRFLAHDYDIDLGINAEEIETEKLILHLCKSTQFVIGKVDYHSEVLRCGSRRKLRRRLSMVKLVHKNGLQVDLFIHYTENGRCWHGSSIHRWENTPFHLVYREFEGIQVLAPADADKYLTENYGAWRTPVKDFNSTTGTPNLVVAHNFISLALFVKRFVVFSQNDRKSAEKLLSAMLVAQVFECKDGKIQLKLKL